MMNRHERRWTAALAENEAVLAEFETACRRVPGDAWQSAPDTGGWSPAAVALHVCVAYEVGAAAAAGGPGMRMRLSPAKARLARMLLLPFMFATTYFPRGVRAPREVVPNLDEARLLTPDAASERLRDAAARAATALRDAAAERPSLRIRHAYFGDIAPLAALRMLSAHTRHHARQLGS